MVVTIPRSGYRLLELRERKKQMLVKEEENGGTLGNDVLGTLNGSFKDFCRAMNRKLTRKMIGVTLSKAELVSMYRKALENGGYDPHSTVEFVLNEPLVTLCKVAWNMKGANKLTNPSAHDEIQTFLGDVLPEEVGFRIEYVTPEKWEACLNEAGVESITIHTALEIPQDFEVEYISAHKADRAE